MFKKQIILLLFILFYNYSFSQMKGLLENDESKLLNSNAQSKMSMDKFISSELQATGSVIDAEHYLIGPGDVLSFHNLNVSTITEYLIITPECAAIIPRIGEISLKGFTLSKAREEILKKVKEWNPNSLVYISLVQPRTVIVSVKGNVLYPGTYNLPASYNISTLLLITNQEGYKKETSSLQTSMYLTNAQYAKNIDNSYRGSNLPFLISYINRNIFIKHRDGSTQNIDLDLYFAYQNIDNNPYLREGDEITIPYNNYKDIQTNSITGAVLRPYTTVYKEGDKASLLLKSALGLKDNADFNNINLINSNNVYVKLNIDSNLNIIGDDIPLEPGNIVIVGQKSHNKKSQNATVSIVGNVKMPGIYPIIKSKSKIKDLIELAGGFTEDAYLPLANIIRKPQNELTNFNPQQPFIYNFHFSDLSMQDTARFKMDIDYTIPKVSCDFVAAFKFNQADQNVLLNDGDYIIIPSNPGTVYVFGQVGQSGYVSFEAGKNFEWYVQKAGGFAIGAKKGKVRIIRGNTKVWIEADKDAQIFAGDEIYVPRPSDDPPGSDIQTYGVIAGVLGATAGLINVLYWIIFVKK